MVTNIGAFSTAKPLATDRFKKNNLLQKSSPFIRHSMKVPKTRALAPASAVSVHKAQEREQPTAVPEA